MTVGQDTTPSGPRASADPDLRKLLQKELETILRFSALINSSLKIETVLDAAMKGAEEFMDAEASTVYELDQESHELLIRIARGEKKEPVKDLRLMLGEGIAGRVVQTGQPMVVQDVEKERAFSDKFDKLTGFKTRSMICVPLILRGKPIGALQVLNKKSQAPFTQSDLELLTAMSQQISVALDNAKLYGRLQERFRLTEGELRETQERLIRSERLAATGHLVQGVAHEIRNPITTIGGFAKRIQKACRHDAKLQEYANIILEETDRLDALVREVREFALIQSADLKQDEIRPVLEQAVKRLEDRAKAQGVTLAVQIEEGMPLIRMDAPQILLAVSNIVENALESMPQGGRLGVRADHVNGHIRLEFRDTGCGIPEDQLDAVYDPFVTSKTRGAGLGLTVVHQIVMNHSGEIRIESKEDMGTTVILKLPA